MTAYSGITFTSLSNFLECASLSTFYPIPPVLNFFMIGDQRQGNKESSAYIPLSNMRNGNFLGEQWEILKNKIIISTTEYSLGTIVDSIVKTFYIWNTFSQQAMLETISVSSENQGISISGISVGYVLDALHGIPVSLTIDRFGKLNVNSKYSFMFNLQDCYILISGVRGIILIKRPLVNGYAESRAWNTDVFISENGTEYRSLLMDCEIPRRTITFPFSIGRNRAKDYASVENIITFGLKQEMFVPLWHSATKLSQDASGTTIYCDTSNCDFDQVNKIAIISQSGKSYTVRGISSIGATSLLLDQSVSGFEIGDFVLPLIITTPDTENSMEWNFKTGKGSIKFLEVDE
jgi:hypothetical protein